MVVGRAVMAIIELLEELFLEPPMLPRDPMLRADARSFAHLITSDLHPINNNRVRRAKTYLFCFVERPGLADACLVPQIANARRFQCDLRRYPLLLTVDQRCWTLAAFQRARPDAMPDYVNPPG